MGLSQKLLVAGSAGILPALLGEPCQKGRQDACAPRDKEERKMFGLKSAAMIIERLAEVKRLRDYRTQQKGRPGGPPQIWRRT